MVTADSCKRMASECIALRVRLLNRVITKIYDESLRPYGLRTAQLNILVAVSLMQSATPSDIEERLSLEKSTVSRNMERMHDRGWVQFVPTEDGRSHQVHLTAQGAALLRKVAGGWEDAQNKAASFLGKEGVTALSRLGVPRRTPTG